MTRILRSFLLPAILAAACLASPARAQMSESELVMRLNRLENEVRQLTGQVEQLQYRNQQLEQQLRGAQPASASVPQRSAAPQPQYTPPPAYPQQQAYPQVTLPQPSQRLSAMEIEPYSAPPPPAGGRRGDAEYGSISMALSR